MNYYNTQARIYWSTTALLGFAVLAFAMTRVAALGISASIEVLIGALAAAVSGMFPIRIPGAKTSVAVADVFVFLLLVHFGPEAAAIAAAAEAGAISVYTSARWTSRLGSPAMAGLAMYVGGVVFAYAQSSLPLANDRSALTSCALGAGAALVYFAIGTLLMASLIRLTRREAIRPILILREYDWLALGYVVSAVGAVLLYTSVVHFGASGMAAAIPLIAVLVGVMHFWFRRSAAASM
jgi:hypothetical protein